MCWSTQNKRTSPEPYDRTKVPILLVHGLWDHASTWNPMVHALQRDAQISAKYQLWTFSYGTYSPFWVGAASLRSELNRIAREHLGSRPSLPLMPKIARHSSMNFEFTKRASVVCPKVVLLPSSALTWKLCGPPIASGKTCSSFILMRSSRRFSV